MNQYMNKYLILFLFVFFSKNLFSQVLYKDYIKSKTEKIDTVAVYMLVSYKPIDNTPAATIVMNGYRYAQDKKTYYLDIFKKPISNDLLVWISVGTDYYSNK